MSKKRTSTESSNDEQTNEGLDCLLQQQDENAKRARVTSLYDTTLDDLPIELIEAILVKVVATEVKDMRLARCVWKAKADLVTDRLRTVCMAWTSILSTNSFRTKLHKILDAAETLCMEIYYEAPLDSTMSREPWYTPHIITMKDDILVLYIPTASDHAVFNVYGRSNVAQVKDVIPLPGIYPQIMKSCNLTNCLYIMISKKGGGGSKKKYHVAILRFTKKEDENRYETSTFLGDMWMPNPTLSVTGNGNVVVSNCQPSKELSIISIFDPNGSLQHKIRLTSADTPNYLRMFYDIIPKSNGNLILVSHTVDMHGWKMKLTEIDMDGVVQRQYQSSKDFYGYVCYADKYERILIAEKLNEMEFLDREFNHLEFTGPQLDGDRLISCGNLYYSSERNEVLALVEDATYESGILTIFQFAEE